MFTIDDIYLAYRKFKNSTYYDSTSLHVRLKLAQFDESLIRELNDADTDGKKRSVINRHFSKILVLVNSENPLKCPVLDEFCQGIDVKLTVKEVKNEDTNEEGNTIITNLQQTKHFTIDRCNYLADMSIELHIISVLWVMTVGLKMSKLFSPNCYAYQLALKGEEEEKNEITSGLNLFAPYYDGYQNWRDKAINKALYLLDEKRNAVILSLDIKRYFYSIRLNVEEFVSKGKDIWGLEDRDLRLSCILQRIHECYFRILKEHSPISESFETAIEDKYPLPIGLCSSGVLGNAYLTDFDDLVAENLNPAYYGRYVDDILIVVSDYKLKAKNCILSDLLENKGILHRVDKNDEDSDWIICNHEELTIQKRKLLVEYFDYHESRAVLHKFKKNIDKSRSEFRLLPFDESVEVQFEDDAFSLEYSDTQNKIRSVKDITINKYGASKYLAHKIFLSTFGLTKASETSKYIKETTRQILSYFRGANVLNMPILWEKVASFFVINENTDGLSKFCKQVVSAIDEIDKISELDEANDEIVRLKNDLLETLRIAVAMPLSMNPELKVNLDESINDNRVKLYISLIRSAFLFRHHLMQMPAICYTEYNTANTNLLKINFGEMLKTKFDISVAKYISPIYVHFQDFNLIYSLSGRAIEPNGDSAEEQAWGKYLEFNLSWRYPRYVHENKLFTIIESPDHKEPVLGCQIDIKGDQNNNKPNKTIGLANLKINDTDLKCCILGKPNLSSKRRDELFEILNYAIKKRVDLMVLPELSIPVVWLPLLVKQCYRNGIGMVFGVEYLYDMDKPDGAVAYNKTAVVLPINYQGMKTCLIRLRTKNHYSPGEGEFLRGHHKSVPPTKSVYYDLFHWRSCYFSVYNCFELTNISDRALFKSKVDFIVATEFNKDVNYFSNITESWSRDLHCYIVQVNSSQYGDSRIIAPRKSDLKDMVCIKGGLYPLLIVDTLDIDKLRQFQICDYNLQLSAPLKDQFKPTPADFDYQNAQNRIDNK